MKSRVPTPVDCHEFNPIQRFDMPPTPRQLQALAEVCIHGDENEAAACMGVSYQTVKNQISGLHQRIGSTSIVQCAYFLGWISIPEKLEFTQYVDVTHSHMGGTLG